MQWSGWIFTVLAALPVLCWSARRELVQGLTTYDLPRNSDVMDAKAAARALQYYRHAQYYRGHHQLGSPYVLSQASDESDDPVSSSDSSEELPSVRYHKEAKAAARALQYYRHAQYYRGQHHLGYPYGLSQASDDSDDSVSATDSSEELPIGTSQKDAKAAARALRYYRHAQYYRGQHHLGYPYGLSQASDESDDPVSAMDSSEEIPIVTSQKDAKAAARALLYYKRAHYYQRHQLGYPYLG